MAERVRPGVWTIQGQTVTLPVHVSARLTAAVFAAPVAGAMSVLQGTPLRPFTIAGRALSVLMCLRYDEWALGRYDEVGVGLLALGPRFALPGLYLADLPVTGAFTREAGQDLWALPKWIMECDLRFGATATSVAVREVFTATLRHGGVRFPGVRTFLPAWSCLGYGAQAGQLLRGRVPMRLSGVRLGRGCSVSLESHPMAERMRALGMLGRPLVTVHAERLRGPLGEYTAVSRKL
jgi:hypothetical protein